MAKKAWPYLYRICAMVVDLRPAASAVVTLIRIWWGVISSKPTFVISRAMAVRLRREVYVCLFCECFSRMYIERIHIVISARVLQTDWRSGVTSYQCAGGQLFDSVLIWFTVSKVVAGWWFSAWSKLFRFKSDTPYQILILLSGSFSLFFFSLWG